MPLSLPASEHCVSWAVVGNNGMPFYLISRSCEISALLLE